MDLRRRAERLFQWAVDRVMRDHADTWDAHVLPHGPIEELAPGLWRVTGTVPPRGIFPREMILHRLRDSSLLIHSAIALDAAGMAALEALGKPEILIVPNRMHRIDAALYKRRYPDLRVVCPAGVRRFVEEVVPVDTAAEETLPRYGIRCHAPRDIGFVELAYELALPRGTALVLTDLLVWADPPYLRAHVSWLKRCFLRLDGVPPSLGITVIYRWLFLEDRAAFRLWLEELAASVPDLQIIALGHSSPILSDCPRRLAEAAARFA